MPNKRKKAVAPHNQLMGYVLTHAKPLIIVMQLLIVLIMIESHWFSSQHSIRQEPDDSPQSGWERQLLNTTSALRISY